MNTFYGYVIAAILVLWLAYRAAKNKATEGKPKPVDDTGGGYANSIKNAPAAVAQWEPLSKEFAMRYGLPKEIILAQIWTESSGNPNAVGSAGERGLMQLKQIAIDDLRENGYGRFEDWKENPATNIHAGAAYLDLQLKRAGNLKEALGSYNQGYRGNILAPFFGNVYEEKVLTKAKQLGYYG